jgi:hypothetical protein
MGSDGDPLSAARLMRRAPVLVALALLATAAARAMRWECLAHGGFPRCRRAALLCHRHGQGRARVNGSKREVQPYADVGIWPKKGLRGVVHFRLSHRLGGGAVVLSLAGQHLHLAAGASDAWAADPRMDAAIVAAMRSAESMTVSGRDARAPVCRHPIR